MAHWIAICGPRRGPELLRTAFLGQDALPELLLARRALHPRVPYQRDGQYLVQAQAQIPDLRARLGQLLQPDKSLQRDGRTREHPRSPVPSVVLPEPAAF